MITVISRFTIANEMDAEVKEAFKNRPHIVDDAEGFVKMEVISPLDKPKEIWLMTWWQNRDFFETWHHSHKYKDAHADIPKGLKLVPRSSEIIYFEHVCS